MKKIIFNVPDSTAVVHFICVSHYLMANGQTGANLNAQFYDLREGQTEFTPDIQLPDEAIGVNANQNKKQEAKDARDS